MHLQLRGDPPRPSAAKSPESAPIGTDRESRLLCAACRAEVTRSAARIERFGGHVHSHANPAGVVFTFGCFSQAHGAHRVGEPTAEHSWFAGHTWQIAVCAACHAHLGWRFHQGGAGGASDPFFGLVLERLLEEETGGPS